MAAVTSKHFFPWWRCGFRLYSQYSRSHKEPAVEHQTLRTLLEKVPEEELQATKRKASRNTQSCSVFYDPVIEKFINYVMRKGKRTLARSLVDSAFCRVKHIQLRKYHDEKDEEIKKEIMINPQEIFHTAVKNVTPLLNVTKIKKSGTWYNVPVGITEKQGRTLAMKWIVNVCSVEVERKLKVKRTPFVNKLANELLAAVDNQGKAYQKKLELHKLCEANRGYAHYKFG